MSPVWSTADRIQAPANSADEGLRTNQHANQSLHCHNHALGALLIIYQTDFA